MAKCVNDNIGQIEYGPTKCLLDLSQDICSKDFNYYGRETIQGDGGIRFCFGDLPGKLIPRVRAICAKGEAGVGFKMPEYDTMLKCCIGTKDQGGCPPLYCPQSTTCDAFMLNHCRKSENYDNEECGCLLPQSKYVNDNIFGPPECVDKRCASNSIAYRSIYQRNPVCPVVNCSISENQLSAVDKANIGNITLINQCGSNNPNIIPADKVHITDTPNYIIIGVFSLIIIIVVICIIYIIFKK